jgi:hypothetical protein
MQKRVGKKKSRKKYSTSSFEAGCDVRNFVLENKFAIGYFAIQQASSLTKLITHD